MNTIKWSERSRSDGTAQARILSTILLAGEQKQIDFALLHIAAESDRRLVWAVSVLDDMSNGELSTSCELRCVSRLWVLFVVLLLSFCSSFRSDFLFFLNSILNPPASHIFDLSSTFYASYLLLCVSSHALGIYPTDLGSLLRTLSLYFVLTTEYRVLSTSYRELPFPIQQSPFPILVIIYGEHGANRRWKYCNGALRQKVFTTGVHSSRLFEIRIIFLCSYPRLKPTATSSVDGCKWIKTRRVNHVSRRSKHLRT